MTTTTPTTALAPVLAALATSEAADAALSDAIGAECGHGMLGDRSPCVRVFQSVGAYMLTCVSTGDRTGFRVNCDTYATPESIPAARRKLRAVAVAFADSSALIRAALDARAEYDRLYAAWRIAN